jgi:hypothetical protein
MKWKDKRDVLAVSTRHTGKIVTLPRLNRRGAQVNKPDLILDYNQHMGGVDRVDQILSYYSPLRKSIKWYRKVVFHIFDLCIGNAYHIYKHLGGRNPQLWFRKQVIRGLVSAVPPPVQGPQKRPLAHHKWSDPSRLVVGQGHFIVQIPREGHAKATPMRQCVLCTKNKRRKEIATNARPATARQHYAWVASRISTLKLCCRLAYFTWELGLAHRRGSHSSDINWASHISVCAQIVDDTIIDFEIKYNAVGLAHRRGSHSLDDNWASHISVCMLNRDEITINMGNFARGTGKELFAISDWYARATFFEILVVANVLM